MKRYPTISLKKTGANISRLMEENNITVKNLQDEFHFEYPQAIYKWKRGESIPSIDNLIVLAVLFKTTIDKIIVID